MNAGLRQGSRLGCGASGKVGQWATGSVNAFHSPHDVLEEIFHFPQQAPRAIKMTESEISEQLLSNNFLTDEKNIRTKQQSFTVDRLIIHRLNTHDTGTEK